MDLNQSASFVPLRIIAMTFLNLDGVYFPRAALEPFLQLSA